MTAESFISWVGAVTIVMCMTLGAILVTSLYVSFMWRRMNDIYAFHQLQKAWRLYREQRIKPDGQGEKSC